MFRVRLSYKVKYKVKEQRYFSKAMLYEREKLGSKNVLSAAPNPKSGPDYSVLITKYCFSNLHTP
jgi:hypothetical protein